jgi:ABC-type transport system involved in cytochrome c biogenesis ATPase subunit
VADRSKLFADIQQHLAKGGSVLVATHYKTKLLRPQHQDRIKLVRGSIYIARGKQWDCADYCNFRFSK